MPFPALPDPATRAARLFGLAKAVPAVAFLSSTLLALNAAQTASLLVRPVSRSAFRRFNRAVADWWWGACVDWAKGLHGTHVRLSGDELPMRENAIVIVNHQQMSDITFLMFLARAKGRLGDMKWLVKDVVKYVPGVGWGMVFLDCVFVKRDWTADRASIEATFSRLTGDRVPVWLVSFPEGTRITIAKHRQSCAFAAERAVDPYEHLLVPRAKGFAASVQGLRGHATAVYDLTIGYPDGVPTLWQYIRGFATVAHIHVRRFPLESLPEDHSALGQWLFDRFREKDALLSHFARTGAFPATAPAQPERAPAGRPARTEPAIA